MSSTESEISASQTPELSEQPEPKPEIAGISKIENSDQLPTLPEPSSTTKTIEAKLQEKIDAGFNLSDKSVYPRIFKEIAESEKCSYQNVAKVAKRYLNLTKRQESTINSEKSVIKIKGIAVGDAKPPRKNPSMPEISTQTKIIPTSPEKKELQLEFDQTMIEMSFDSVGNFENMLLGIKPKSAKLKKLARTVAIYNQQMEDSGHPEERINVGSSLQKYLIYAAILGTLLEPIGEKFMNRSKEKKSGIEQKSSMR